LQKHEYKGKRIVDIVITVAAMPVWVPIGLVCAVLVRLDSTGPIIFRQPRIGWAGAAFNVLKFRTMFDSPDGNPIIPDDARVTRVGRALRRWSLDELPQLVNVLRGEMSLVGPRPTLSYQVERYDNSQRQRLAVRPGLTGLAQVNGRNRISWAERIQWDLEYVKRQSLWLDLRLLARTPAAVLSARGVSGHSADDPLAAPPNE
jgi:lipopolysaccharide/colanic/teichoic acid biosynthesis glycosyltransferase